MKRPPAIFSPCRRYRYVLWREWDLQNPDYAMFIGLNPSTADEVQDDPTVRRCINFAKDWGFGALCMTNIFAFRATDPAVMKAEDDPIGYLNDVTLQTMALGAGVVVAAWGVHGTHICRDQWVKSSIPNLKCLGKTKDGHPKHPLYLHKHTILQPL